MKRGFKRTILGLAVSLLARASSAGAAESTGKALAGLEPFDTAMQALLAKWDVPGGALAVARDGRLVLARGYGYANRERQEPVQPTSLFRLGSLNKMIIMAVAVLQLRDAGRLNLDDKVLPILGEIGPRPEHIADKRMNDITIRQLLQHTAGFDRDRSGDPLFPPRAVQAAARQGAAMPPTCEAILRDTLESPLDFAPGSRFAYSNIGYCILGRVIERLSGERYTDVVRQRISGPIGSPGLQPGRTLTALPGEVTYYTYAQEPLADAVPGLGLRGKVTLPYGGFPFEAFDALGQYVGSPVDFLRFILAIDGTKGPALLRPESLREMRRRPSIPGEEGKASFYGLGTLVRPVTGGDNWFHSGSQSGMKALAVRYANGNAWVVAVNTRPKDRDGFAGDLDRSLIQAAQRVGRGWPGGSLWSEF